jgi:hypothetical protein
MALAVHPIALPALDGAKILPLAQRGVKPIMVRNDRTRDWTRPDRRSSFILFALLCLLFVALVSVRAYHFGSSIDRYYLATLAINYFDFGAVHRGLAGSISYLSGLDLPMALVLFYVATTVAFIAEATWIVARRDWANQLDPVRFVLVLVAIVGLWAKDAGRTDALIAMLLAPAAAAALYGRLVITSALITIGLFAHETSFIYGIPLVVAVLLSQSRLKLLLTPQGAFAAALLLCGTALYASLPHLPHANVAQIVASVGRKVGVHPDSEKALFFTLGGERGLRAAMCMNSFDANFLLHGLTALVMIAICVFVLAGTEPRLWAPCLLAALPPFVLLWIIALDNARWITLSIVNIWLVCALAKRGESRFGYVRLAFAAALVLLNAPIPAGYNHGIFATSPVVDAIAGELSHASRPDVYLSFEHCDPDWRSVLSGSDADRH